MVAKKDEGTQDKDTKGQPDVEKIVIEINNQKIEIPKFDGADEVAKLLKDTEHNLQSGLKMKYEKQLEELRAGQQKVETDKHAAAQLLKEDTEWYSTHPQKAWKYYVPKLEGGQGYIGHPDLLNEADDDFDDDNVKPNASKKTNPLEPDPIAKKLSDMETKVSNLELSLTEQGAREAANKMLELQKTEQYKHADIQAVAMQMQSYHARHNKPASVETIKEFLTTSHNRVAEILKGYVKKEPDKKLEIPEPSGLRVVKGLGKLPAMDERHASVFTDYAANALKKIKEGVT